MNVHCLLTFLPIMANTLTHHRWSVDYLSLEQRLGVFLSFEFLARHSDALKNICQANEFQLHESVIMRLLYCITKYGKATHECGNQRSEGHAS